MEVLRGGNNPKEGTQNKKFWQYVRHHSSFLLVLLSTPKLQRETSTNKVKFIALDMKSFWISTSKLHINILLALASQMKWRNFSNIWFSFSSWFWIHYSPGINVNNDYTYCCSLKQERIILQGFILVNTILKSDNCQMACGLAILKHEVNGSHSLVSTPLCAKIYLYRQVHSFGQRYGLLFFRTPYHQFFFTFIAFFKVRSLRMEYESAVCGRLASIWL